MDRPSLPRSVSCAFLVLATLASSTGCTSLLGEKPKGPLGNLDLKGLQAAGTTWEPMDQDRQHASDS